MLEQVRQTYREIFGINLKITYIKDMKKIIKWFKDKQEDCKRKKRFKKKIEELKKRDPFIYNH